jgi:hypothetical protein
MVDDAAEQYAEVFATPADQNRDLAYRIVAVSGTGDDIAIFLEQREMTANNPATPSGPTSAFHLHRQTSGQWKVVDWGDLPED